MLPARVEKKASAGLDDAAKIRFGELPADVAHFVSDVRRIRVEAVVVEGDGGRAVTDFGEDLERVDQPMMGEAVGVVAEFEGHERSPYVEYIHRPDAIAGMSNAMRQRPACQPWALAARVASNTMIAKMNVFIPYWTAD